MVECFHYDPKLKIKTPDLLRKLLPSPCGDNGSYFWDWSGHCEKYASHKTDLLLVNRNEQKSKILCEELKNDYNVNCSYILADFAKLSDIHSAAEKLINLERSIDVLIHNAGIFNTTRILTADHLEAVFQTNYLSTFILNYSLKEKFRNQASGRIIFVNSEAYRFAAFGLHLDDLSWNKVSLFRDKRIWISKTSPITFNVKI